VLLLTKLAPQLQALIERSTDAAVTQPQLVTLMDEPAQRKQPPSNDIENLLESRARFPPSWLPCNSALEPDCTTRTLR
jgi:hypothetical protein